jgi:hypothetical protein
MAKPVGVFVVGPQGSRFISTHEARRTLGVLAFGVLLGLILRRKRRERLPFGRPKFSLRG